MWLAASAPNLLWATATAASAQTTRFSAAIAHSSTCHDTTASDLTSSACRARKFELARAIQPPVIVGVRPWRLSTVTWYHDRVGQAIGADLRSRKTAPAP